MLASLLAVVALAVWAPGYVLLLAIHPRGRLSALERHAMALALGLVLLPLVGLLASVTVGFTWVGVAAWLVVLVVAAGAVAAARRGTAVREAASHSLVPSTRVTLALTLAALAVAGAVWAWPGASQRTPPALWLEDGAGQALALPSNVTSGAPIRVVVLVASGDAPLDGTLTVSWDGNATTHAVRLSPDQRASWTLDLGTTGAPGDRAFDARLDAAGGVARDVHFLLRVGSGA